MSGGRFGILTLMADAPTREIIMEQVRIGQVVRVTAVDVATGTEVVFQAPTYASPASLQKLAVQKLQYVMKKSR